MAQEEVKISPAVLIPVGLGLGLVGALAIYAIARAAVGFTVQIRNAPVGSVFWHPFFIDINGNVYEPETLYGCLGLDEVWACPADAMGEYGLQIECADADYNITYSHYNIGPVYSKKAYVYDCSTGVLEEIL